MHAGIQAAKTERQNVWIGSPYLTELQVWPICALKEAKQVKATAVLISIPTVLVKVSQTVFYCRRCCCFFVFYCTESPLRITNTIYIPYLCI